MEIRIGCALTKKEFERLKALAVAKNDVAENRKKFWRNQITDADIAYMVKAMEAPDVNQFLAVI